MTQVASLYTSMTLESSSFLVGLKQAVGATERAAQGIERQMNRIIAAGSALAGAFAIDAVIAASRRALDYASSLGEVAQQVGVTTRDLQVYRYAASQAGIEQSEMDAALARLTRTMGEAAAGSKAQATTFRELGVSVTDASGRMLTAGDVIPRIADALSRIQDPATRARYEIDLFGRAGQKLDTLLAGGSAAIDGLRRAASDLGIVLEDRLINQADTAADKMAELKMVLEAKLSVAVTENANSILYLVDALAKLVDWAGKGARAWRIVSLQTEARRQQMIADGWFTSAEDRLKALTAAQAARQEIFDMTVERPRVAAMGAAGVLLQPGRTALGGAASSPQGALPRVSRSGGGGGGGRRAARSEMPWWHSTLRGTRDMMSELGASAAANPESAIADSSRRFYDAQGISPSSDWQKIVERIQREAEVRYELESEAVERIEQLREDRIQTTANMFDSLLQGGADNFLRNLKSNMLSLAAQFVARLIAGQSLKLAGSAVLGSILPGFAQGGSMTIGGRSGVDRNVLQLNGMPIARVSRGETIDVRNGETGPQGRGGLVVAVEASPYFDARVREVATPVAATFAQGAVMGGAALAQRKAGKAASRRMGRG